MSTQAQTIANRENLTRITTTEGMNGYTPSYDDLQINGELIETTQEGTVQLWNYEGSEFVVLCDNSVITRDEDLSDNPFFPLK